MEESREDLDSSTRERSALEATLSAEGLILILPPEGTKLPFEI